MKNKITLALIVSILLLSNVKGQNLWLPENPNSISLEVLKPSISNNAFGFGGAPEYTFLSSAIFLSANISLSNKLNLYSEIPMVYSKVKNTNLADDSGFIVGNIYIGIQTNNADKSLNFELGLRLPTTGSDFITTDISLLADFDRADAFLDDLVSIPIKAVYKKTFSNGGFLKIRGGFDIWIAKKIGDNESELWIDHSIQYGKSTENFDFLVGISGLTLLSEEDIDFSERIAQHFGVALNYSKSKITPGILFKLPLDNELNDILDYTIGINLTHQF